MEPFAIVLTLGVVIVAIIAMMVSRAGPDLILLAGLTVLIIAGVVPSKAAVSGFANEGLITVAVLFIVAEGLEQTGAIGHLIQRMLGLPKSRINALMRLMFPTAAMSAFLNNTPVVAVMLPVLDDWAKKCRLAVSQLMMPLSFATILGGLCTVLGTSTTVVVNELVRDEGLRPLSLFEPGLIGFPCCLVGLTYILLTSKILLPDRKPASMQFDDPREYTIEMLVEETSPLVGKTIEDAGLRHLPGMFLMEIDRDGHTLPAVGPNERVVAGDRLVFVGVVESVVDLQKLPGLTPATNQVFKLDSPRSERCLIEAVASDSCPVVNMTIREARFRTRYNAVVIAVSRNGQRLRAKIGDITLHAGDTLLLEAHTTFVDVQRNSRDFYLVSRVDNSTPLRREKAWIAQLVLIGLVLLNTVFQWEILPSALLAAVILILTGCVKPAEARASIDWSVLITIAAGIGIGEAMKEEHSGAGPFVAEYLTGFANGEPIIALTIIYGITMVFTNLITAKAAATLLFPVAISTAGSLDVSAMPFVVAVMIAAAASFATPVGYQTNLMVQGPGGYRYADYLRFGGPLSLLLWLVAVLVIPFWWKF
ncbi:potassium transporter peripheral membrane component [Thalassoglobus neptunius]|uniref:Potassium transporter peripheral membrane component n=1 Tax=Thalassoglobus neptunius TaxID=1938619 RepID=A0A5C5WN36_9PLAN|nr:SLC13 family permease [Thalassoglobus neptunius]TWT52246.1 potassium transporter peripheral membrane component [Thalassoglobus neptunius]